MFLISLLAVSVSPVVLSSSSLWCIDDEASLSKILDIYQ